MKKARSTELVHENVIPPQQSSSPPGSAGSKFISNSSKSNGNSWRVRSTISSSYQQYKNSSSNNTNSMAGDIRIMDQKVPRKTWALQDRSALNVHLLKANLAEDGCEEAQLDVAKNLMQESTDESVGVASQRENARKAIYWLIRSSEQGNEEATNLLKHCIKSGEGITCQNISDVRSCVITPRKEKLVFKAARRLYDKLSNGEEFITTTQIKEYRATKEDNESRSHYLDETFAVDDEEHNRTFTIDNDNDSPGLKRPSSPTSSAQALYSEDELQHLVKQDAAKLTRKDLLKVATSYNNGEIPQIPIDVVKSQRYHWNLCTVTNAFLLQFFVLSMFLNIITFHSVLLLLTSIISLWTAFHLWTWPYRLSVVEDWTSAFKSVLQNNPVADFTCRNKLILKQVLPLLVTTILCLGALHLLNGPPCVVMALAVLTLMGVFRGFVNSAFKWQTGFMIITTLMSSPIFSPIYLQIMSVIDSHVKEIINSHETLDYLSKECEQFLPSIDFQTAVAVINLAVIAESYLHTRRTSNVLEQLAVFLWWFKLTSTFSTSTVYSNYLAVVIAVIVGVSFYLLESNKSLWHVTTWIVVAVACIALASVTYALIAEAVSLPDTNNTNDGVNQLTWDEYNEQCHRRAWKTKSVGETQLECVLKYECTDAPLRVTWSGKISVIKITDIKKTSYAQVFDAPMTVKDIFIEILVNVEHNSETKDEGSRWPAILSGTSKEKEVLSIVSVLITTENIIGAEEKLKTVRRLLKLRADDVVEFHGFLLRGSGGLKPEIGKVNILRCLNCAGSDYEPFYFKRESLLTRNLVGWVEGYIGSHNRLVLTLSEAENTFRNFIKCTLEYIKSFY